MIPELGSFSLILALCLSALLGSLPIAGAHYNNPVWISMARPLTAGVFVFLGLAISALAYAFITDDFSVSFVAQHSNTLLPCVTSSLRCGVVTKAPSCCGPLC